MSRNEDLSVPPAQQVEAPSLPYRAKELPRTPRIALVGCGGIAPTHLQAYQDAGFEVVALHSRTRARAAELSRLHCPDARVCDSLDELLAIDGLDAVDLTPHPADREALIEQAIDAGVPVLSQKPLAVDLPTAVRLVARAERAGVPFAVNQNGRFAPHLAWIREAVRAGLVGRVHTVRVSIQWDHNWVAGTPFDQDEDLLLKDFGIHWFDLVCALLDGEPREVAASVARTATQTAKPPLSGRAFVTFDGAEAELQFDGDTKFGQRDQTLVLGSAGTLRSEGPPLEDQRVTLWTADGWCRPQLVGRWFPGAFHGAMAELLDAAWRGREPLHSARGNLRSLALCERAVAASRAGPR